MINISVICVGKLKEQFLRDGCAEYIKRLSPYAKTQIIEIAEERAPDAPSEAEILCIEGREFSSPEFAQEIEKLSLGNSKIAFVIGGSFGLSDKVKSLGTFKLSFGKMTLPHQLARLVLCEQVYRAFSILNHARYHK